MEITEHSQLKVQGRKCLIYPFTQDLEYRLTAKDAELGDLRGRLMRLREDFQYNLSLIDDRDRELERQDAQIARLSAEAGECAKLLREAQLSAATSALEAKQTAQHVHELEVLGLQKVGQLRDDVERERLACSETLLQHLNTFLLGKSLVGKVENRKSLGSSYVKSSKASPRPTARILAARMSALTFIPAR